MSDKKTTLDTNVVKPKVSFIQNEEEIRLMSQMDEISLDSKISEIESYIKNNDGTGKPEEEKDQLYATAQEIWKSYVDYFKGVRYSFYLDKYQFQFLTDVLTKHLEYTHETIFFAMELGDMLLQMKDNSKFQSDLQQKAFELDATEITYMYHIISKHKVKGLGKNAKSFAQVLLKIGEISKIVSYYDTHAKNFNKEIQEWVASFEDGVVSESIEAKRKADKPEEVEAEEVQTED